MNSFYSKEELEDIGFKSVGQNVLISRKTSIYSPKHISIGNNVRIDDFCILSGKITIGNYVHIAAFCGFFGGEAGITMNDFSTISSRGSIYALTDDYSGEYMTNPMVSSEYTNVKQSPVTIGKHVVIGTNSTILPGVNIGDGCAFGASSLVIRDCKEWTIYTGIPVKELRPRKRDLLKYENNMIYKGVYSK
ncbi:acyltransferase [Clostridium prolinivorans]|uniref:acyltransferase n=1 Tax=Clostridium prolinivorans TaxID=2769420 RepID=UPI000FDB69B1|nr:acyltransferase [Clostridium prolinivorans]